MMISFHETMRKLSLNSNFIWVIGFLLVWFLIGGAFGINTLIRGVLEVFGMEISELSTTILNFLIAMLIVFRIFMAGETNQLNIK